MKSTHFMIKIILLILFTNNAFAAVDTIDDLFVNLHKSIFGWTPTIKTACLYVFYILILIDFVWTFGVKFLQGSEYGDLVATLVKKIIYIGVFLFLFNIDSWIKVIYESFTLLTQKTIGSSAIATPNMIVDKGYVIAKKLLSTMSLHLSPSAVFRAICVIIIVLACSFMSVTLFLAYLKFYVLTIVCFFAFALAGLSFFKKIGINPILYTIKVGLELLLLQGILSVILKYIDSSETILLALNKTVSNEAVLYFLISTVVACMIVMSVPKFIEKVLINHFGEFANGGSGSKNTVTTPVNVANTTFNQNKTTSYSSVNKTDPGALRSYIVRNDNGVSGGSINIKAGISNFRLSDKLKEKQNIQKREIK